MSTEHFKNGVPPLAGEGSPKNFKQQQYITNHQNPTDRLLDAIRDRGGSVEPSGGQWMCTCPAHDDRTPSLSVRQGDDGSVLLKCFAGCSTESIVLVLGMKMRDLFHNEAPLTVTSRPQPPKNPRTDSGSSGSTSLGNSFELLEDAIDVYERRLGQHDFRWDYHDAQGELSGIVLRWDTDSGKEIRPISRIDGRWYLKGMPEPRPLYMLTELRASTDLILVCEGEKATDAAIACGYTATTNPHGSKSAMQADWSVLKDRDVIIIPDLDEAGDAFASTVRWLCESARSVHVLDLSVAWPHLKEKGDLADVLAIEGGDTGVVRAKLEALIGQASPESSLEYSEKTPIVYRHFPVDLLPEPMRSYVSQGSKALGCDPSYIALSMLVMFAGAVGNSHRIRLKSTWTEPCILWGCVIGRSGTNKSAAIHQAIKPLQEIQERSMFEHHAMIRDWDPDSGLPRPVMRRSIIDDATIESVMQVSELNPKGVLLYRDEINGWFNFDKYSNAKGSTNSARWIELFHGRPVSVDRATKDPIFVPRASLSIIGGIQPGILQGVLDRNNLESGLAARFLFVMPPHLPKRWSTAELDPEIYSKVSRVVVILSSTGLNTVGPGASEEEPQPHMIGLRPEAARLFERFFNRHNRAMENEDEKVAVAWSKLECYVARFALLLHLVREAAGDCLEDPERVDAVTMQAAINLVEWFKHETKRVYAMLAMDDAAREDQRAVEWIRNQGGAVTVRKFSRGLATYNNAKRAEQKLKSLEIAGYGFFQGLPPNGKTEEFVLHDEFRNDAASTVTATSRPVTLINPQTDSGANGRYPVPSTEEEN